MPPSRLLARRPQHDRFVTPPARDALQLHERLPGYAPTPLRDAPDLATLLNVQSVWLKDETQRLGLPSFKVLGAS